MILEGGKSGLSAGPVFRVMACPEHRAFRAHMEPITRARSAQRRRSQPAFIIVMVMKLISVEPITSYDTDPGRETLNPKP